MKKALCLLPFLFLSVYLIHAQQNETEAFNRFLDEFSKEKTSVSSLKYLDSAMYLAKQLDSAHWKALVYRQYGNFYSHDDRKKAIDYFHLAKESYGQIKDTLRIGSCDFVIAIKYYELSKLDSAEAYYNNAIEKYNLVGYNDGVGGCYNGLGLIKKKLGDYESAIKYYLHAIKNLSKKRYKAEMYVNIALLYKMINNPEKELEFHKKALSIFEAEQLEGFMAKCYSNLGDYYQRDGNYKKAADFLIKAKQINIKTQDTLSLGITLNNLGVVYYEQKEPTKAEEYLGKVLKISPNRDDYIINIGIAKQYLGLIQVEKNNCLSGLNLLNESISSFSKANDIRNKGFALRDYSKALESCGKYREALFTHKSYLVIHDSLNSHKKQRNVEDLLTKYQTEKKEAENQLLKKEKELKSATIKQQRFTLFGTLVGLGLLALLSFLLYRRSQERKKTNIQLAAQKEEIEALHKELSHRVKNNLLFMSSLLHMQGKSMEDGEAKQAIKEGEARLEAMSLLHRRLGLEDNKNKIHLGDYIKEICSYLKVSFPQSEVNPEISVTSEHIYIDPEYAMRLGIIINELITNSLKHAFDRQTNPMIRADISYDETGNLSMHYEDNGKGLPDDFINKTDSLGMKLIRTLTKQLNGNMTVLDSSGASISFTFRS